MYSIKHRLGVMVPGNNSTLEPELWSRMPAGSALYASRLMLKGDVTADALKGMEAEISRSAAELMATVVDVIMIADMVVSFIMEPDWNDRRTREITAQYKVPCVTGWTALHDALRHLGIKKFAMISPYPQNLQALAGPFFARHGFKMTADTTFDFMDMLKTPMITPEQLRGAVDNLDLSGAEALLILSTDVPTFESIEPLEQELGIPILTQNQTLFWSALNKIGNTDKVVRLGRLFAR
ncbi:hypothetical protein [Microvirga massiliensis]|uniref:maleate cis-trans isomerase family protein n=1 Tax=Microvirga massiliensis TaxID=1033741 RepID=UPI00062BB981